jgi:hypothetical protein
VKAQVLLEAFQREDLSGSWATVLGCPHWLLIWATVMNYGDFGILRIQGEYELAKLYKAALAKLMSVLRGHGCCSCLCCCCMPEEGTCFLDPIFFFLRKLGLGKNDTIEACELF